MKNQTNQTFRIEERIIQAMIANNLVVTEAIEEQVYAEVFNCPSVRPSKIRIRPDLSICLLQAKTKRGSKRHVHSDDCRDTMKPIHTIIASLLVPSLRAGRVVG